MLWDKLTRDLNTDRRSSPTRWK